MADTPNDPDRAILKDRDSGWTGEPERTLTEEELDRLVRLFDDFDKSREKELRSALKRLFRSFVGMAIKERFRDDAGNLPTKKKPSTRVAEQMTDIETACDKLDLQLAKLNPATKTWLDRHLRAIGATDRDGSQVRLKDLLDQMRWSMDHLIHAAHSAEGIAKPGPNNAALRYMVEGLANWWEEVRGRPPTTEKARGLRDDPFLDLCQEMARIADARLAEKGGRLGTLQLSGLVPDVLESRRSRAGDTPREK